MLNPAAGRFHLRPNRSLLWLLVPAGAAVFLLAPGALPEKLMSAVAGVCPQRPTHSLFLGELPLPLEARMTGIFGGFLVTALYARFFCAISLASLPSPRFFTAMVSLIGVMVLDGLNATGYDLGTAYLYPPANGLRLATGLLAGIAVALLFVPLVKARTWRRTPRTGSGITPFRVGGLLAANACFGLAASSGSSAFYYLAALLSVGGMVVITALLNMLLILSVSRRAHWQGRDFSIAQPERGADSAVRPYAELAGRRQHSASAIEAERGAVGSGDFASLAPYGVVALGLTCLELAGLAVLRHSILS